MTNVTKKKINFRLHPILVSRKEFGEFHALYNDLREDNDEFAVYSRQTAWITRLSARLGVHEEFECPPRYST